MREPERLAQVLRRTKCICRLSIFSSVFFLFDEVPHLALLFGIGFKTGKSLDVSFRHFDLDLQRSDRPQTLIRYGQQVLPAMAARQVSS